MQSNARATQTQEETIPLENPFLDLAFEDLFDVPLVKIVTTDDSATDSLIPTLHETNTGDSRNEVQTVDEINLLPGPSAGELNNQSLYTLSDHVQIAINQHSSKQILVGSVPRTLSVFANESGITNTEYIEFISQQNLKTPFQTEIQSDPDQPDIYLIKITTLLDVIDTDDTTWSLREAILEANHADGMTEILLSNGIYTLSIHGKNEDNATSGDLDIHGQLLISGLGPSITTIDGNQIDRVFHVFPDANLILRELTITGGFAQQFSGGGIHNSGGVILENVQFTENHARNGGAVYNSAKLSIHGSVFEANHATLQGGAISNSGQHADLEIAQTIIHSNAALYGAGLSNAQGIANIQDSNIFDNHATVLGGGIYNVSGIIDIQDSVFYGNTANIHGHDIFNFSGVINYLSILSTKHQSVTEPLQIRDILYEEPLLINEEKLTDLLQKSQENYVENDFTQQFLVSEQIATAPELLFSTLIQSNMITEMYEFI